MNKKIIAVLLATSMILSISACGNKNAVQESSSTVVSKQETTVSEQEIKETTSQTPVEPEPVTIGLGLPSGYKNVPEEIVESFKAKYPHITLEIDDSPGSEFSSKLKMQIAAGNAPTIFWTDSGNIAYYGGMGALADLTDRVNTDLNADEFSTMLYAGDDGNGHLWGVPVGLNIVAVYYNKTIFDEAGLAYPEEDWTFQELFDTAEKLVKKDANGETIQYGLVNGTYVTDGWLPYVLATGGAPLNETRTESNFDDEKTIEGFRKMLEPVEKGISPSRDWLLAQGTPAAAFYSGNVGIYIALSSQVKNIYNNAPADFEYDVQMMPIGWDGERHCVYVPNLWAISSTATEAEQDAAWLFIQHFLSDESQDVIAAWPYGAGFPVRKSSLEKIQPAEKTPANVSAFYEGADKYGVTLFENPQYNQWRPLVDEVALNMVNGVVELEAGVQDIHEKVSAALKDE